MRRPCPTKTLFQKTDWDAFKAYMKDSETLLKLNLGVNGTVNEVSRLIGEAIECLIPLNKNASSKKATVPWWTSELTEIRKGLHRARRQLTKRRKVGLGCMKEEQLFIRRLYAYNELLEKTKWDLCCAFLEQYGNENDEPNPWGLIHKCAKKASSNDSSFGSLRKEDETLTSSLLDSA